MTEKLGQGKKSRLGGTKSPMPVGTAPHDDGVFDFPVEITLSIKYFKIC